MLKRFWRSFQKLKFDINAANITVYDYYVNLKVILLICGALDGSRPSYMVVNNIYTLITTAILTVTSVCSILSTIHVRDISVMAEKIIYLTLMVTTVLIITAFQADRNLYKTMKNSLQESFLFITSRKGKKYRKRFYKTQLLCSKLCVSLTMFYPFIVSVYLLKCFTNLALFYAFPKEKGTKRPMNIPLKLPKGLDENETPYFEILYVMTCCFGVECTLSLTALTYMLLISVGYLVSQLDIVISDLHRLFRDSPDTLAQEVVHQVLRTRVKVIVDRHNAAYKYLENMVAVYRKWFAFFQIASIHMGFISAYAITSDLDKGIINYIMFLFLVAVFSTLLVICWGMTIVAGKFEEVGGACASADWLRLGAAGRAAARDLQLVLRRSQQALPIRMPGFQIVNLEEYLRISTAIYTYFNMLRQHHA